MYITTMFPYPSGNGIHVGHVYNYAIMDSYCRWMRFQGKEVFQPFGYDSFGLPAENYARKIGGDPREVTYNNIDNFRRQMKEMNTQFEELLITSDPSYYKWTQWIFLKLKEHGLAYKKFAPVNFCDSCETVLANEQVKDEHCDRCGSKVREKEMDQWFFKITDYKQRLIDNLDSIDYPESTIKQQRYWLENLNDWCVSRQRSWGCPIPIEGETDTLDTFVDSSFYFIRYCDPNNDKEICDKTKARPVDVYVGGKEHACMHLIYARFITMFLHDIGVVDFEEPFKKIVHQGMITKDGNKMSKSKGNIVSPDEYDPAVIRMYLSFIGHYFDGGDWDDSNIKGIKRAFGKWQRWIEEEGEEEFDFSELIKKIDGYTEAFKFNKVVSTLMEFYNKNKSRKMNGNSKQKFIEIVSCFAPNCVSLSDEHGRTPYAINPKF